MRSLISALVLAALPHSCAAAALPPATFSVLGAEPGPWPAIFSSIGIPSGPGLPVSIYVLRNGAPLGTNVLKPVQDGALLVLEGQSDAAASFGFIPGTPSVDVTSIVDEHAPKLPIIWEHPLTLPRFTLPKGARVFAKDRWTDAPLLASVAVGRGAVLWMAAPPGELGYERFPYLLQALHDLGLQPPVRAARIWAFFDSGYRSRADLDYLAERWRKAGIAALQVAAWHYWEADPQGDAYLRGLITACHRQGILVYAWLELPHVSEKFWADHPQWREKTAILQDAQLDWRKLMNLENPQVSAEVERGARRLIGAFDWDGVNLAELYFESLEGVANPSRFTPMNGDVRREFQAKYGFDPLELFGERPGPPERMRKFLDYRAALAGRLQQHWLDVMESIRARRPDLDLVVTQVDDRFDTRMKDLIGVDAARAIPLLARHDCTFLVEDPATIWNLGPNRYPQIAARYAPLVQPIPGAAERLAIDINIVERYQDVYPTKQQTGTELFQLVHLASASFPRVALYFENSILPPDLVLLPAAEAGAPKFEPAAGGVAVSSAQAIGVAWSGPVTVDGRLWPYRDEATVWLPPGNHRVEPAQTSTPFLLRSFNGGLRTAGFEDGTLEISYDSSSRAIALLSRAPSKVEIDGASVPPVILDGAPLPGETKSFALLLPRGQHLVTVQ